MAQQTKQLLAQNLAIGRPMAEEEDLETSVAILLDRQKRLGRQGYDAYLQDLYSRLVSLHSSDPRKFSDSYILCALRLAADVHHVEDRLKKHGDFVIYLDAPGKVASSLHSFLASKTGTATARYAARAGIPLEETKVLDAFPLCDTSNVTKAKTMSASELPTIRKFGGDGAGTRHLAGLVARKLFDPGNYRRRGFTRTDRNVLTLKANHPAWAFYYPAAAAQVQEHFTLSFKMYKTPGNVELPDLYSGTSSAGTDEDETTDYDKTEPRLTDAEQERLLSGSTKYRWPFPVVGVIQDVEVKCMCKTCRNLPGRASHKVPYCLLVDLQGETLIQAPRLYCSHGRHTYQMALDGSYPYRLLPPRQVQVEDTPERAAARALDEAEKRARMRREYDSNKQKAAGGLGALLGLK